MSPIYSHRWRILLEMIVVSPAGKFIEITDQAHTRAIRAKLDAE
jgi:hypothetical protein